VALTIKEIENVKSNRKPYKLADVSVLFCQPVQKLWRWRYGFDSKEKVTLLGWACMVQWLTPLIRSEVL